MADPERGHPVINLITGSRLVFAAGVAVLTPWAGDQLWAIIAATVLVLGVEISDLTDGYLARRHNAVSQFGKVFDPFADSVSRLTVYWSLAMVDRSLAVVPLVMAVRDISVAYVRIVMIRRGWDGSARYMGKLKAVVQGVCAVVLTSGPLYWGSWGRPVVYVLSLAVVVVCVASLADYGRLVLRPRQPV